MAEPPVVQAAFRAGLASNRHFYPMKNERLFSKLISTGETEGEYAERSQPYTFVLRPDLIIYKIYNGWFFSGDQRLRNSG